MNKLIYTFLIILSVYTSVSGQDATVDSIFYYYEHDMYDRALKLLESIDTTRLNDKEKAEYYTAGAGIFYYKGNYKKALDFYKKGKTFQKMSPSKKALLNLHGARTYIEISDGKSAKPIISSLDHYVDKNEADSSFVLKYNMVKLLFYDQVGEFDQAMKYATQALKYIKASGSPDQKSSIYITMGEIFRVNEKPEKAMEYYTEAEKIARKNKLFLDLAKIYNNQSIVLNSQGDSVKALNKLKKSAKMAEQSRGEVAALPAYYNLGLHYIELGDYDAGFQYLRKVLDVGQKSGHEQAIYFGHLGVGIYYQKLKKIKDAKYHLHKALKIAKKFNNPPNIGRVYERLYELYNENQISDSALHYYKLNETIKDSLKLAERKSIVENLEAKYQLAQKEKENQELRLKQARQKLSFFVIGGVVLVLILLLILLYSTLRNKYRQNRLLSLQKEQINHKNNLLEKLNDEVSEQKKQLEEMNQIKDSMFSIISHDLRSPLSSVYMLMRMINQEGIDTTQGIKMAKSLTTEVNQAIFLLNNLMTYAHLNIKNIKPEPENVQLKNLVLDTIDFLSMDIETKNLNIDLAVDEQIRVYADQGMFEIIAKNLISNAIKFTPKGGQIEISATQTDHHVIFIVKDTGVGMNLQKQKQIFDAGIRFQKGTEQERGSGLGLYLCKYFIQLHKGSIEVASEEGSGTVFKVTMPKKT